MMEFKFVLHDAKDELPTESGYYLTFDYGFAQTVNYSVRHRAFNCHDSDETPQYVIDVRFWAKVPKEIDEMCDGGRE